MIDEGVSQGQNEVCAIRQSLFYKGQRRAICVTTGDLATLPESRHSKPRLLSPGRSDMVIAELGADPADWLAAGLSILDPRAQPFGKPDPPSPPWSRPWNSPTVQSGAVPEGSTSWSVRTLWGLRALLWPFQNHTHSLTSLDAGASGRW